MVSQGPSTWVRFSSLHHPAANLEEFLAARAVSSCCQLLIANRLSESGIESAPDIDICSRDWGCCRLRTGLDHLMGPDLVSSKTQGMFAVSEPLRISGLEATEAAALTPDGALHLNVTRDTYLKLGLTGTAVVSEEAGICVLQRSNADDAYGC